MALANVEGARVSLGALSLAHPLGSVGALKGRLARHYTRQVLQVVYTVLGSVDFLGNPMSFMHSLGSGMWDFVSAPAVSLLQNPKEFTRGVAKGTASLLSNTIFAFSNAASRMSGAAAKGVAALALDAEYLAELQRRQQELGTSESGVFSAVLEALSGVLEYPVRGLETGGIPGLLSGAAKGLAGLVAKPTASVLELAGQTTRAIRNSTRPMGSRAFRVRPPRHVSRDAPLAQYSWQEAVGRAVLLEADGGRLREEGYVACMPLQAPGRYTLLTGWRLLVVRSATLARAAGEHMQWGEPQWRIDWEALLEDILHLDCSGDRITVLQMRTQATLDRASSNHRRGPLRGGSSTGDVGNNSPLRHGLLQLVDPATAQLLQALILRAITLSEHKRRGSRPVSRANSAVSALRHPTGVKGPVHGPAAAEVT